MDREANLAAQQKLADAVNALIDSNPDDWYPQALAFLNAAHEQAEGELERRLDDSGAAAIEFELISDMGDLAGYYPNDWLPRLLRFALLVNLKIRENQPPQDGQGRVGGIDKARRQ